MKKKVAKYGNEYDERRDKLEQAHRAAHELTHCGAQHVSLCRLVVVVAVADLRVDVLVALECAIDADREHELVLVESDGLVQRAVVVEREVGDDARVLTLERGELDKVGVEQQNAALVVADAHARAVLARLQRRDYRVLDASLALELVGELDCAVLSAASTAADDFTRPAHHVRAEVLAAAAHTRYEAGEEATTSHAVACCCRCGAGAGRCFGKASVLHALVGVVVQVSGVGGHFGDLLERAQRPHVRAIVASDADEHVGSRRLQIVDLLLAVRLTQLGQLVAAEAREARTARVRRQVPN